MSEGGYSLSRDHTGTMGLSGFNPTSLAAYQAGLQQGQTLSNQHYAYLQAGAGAADMAARATTGMSLARLSAVNPNAATAMRLGGGLFNQMTQFGGDAGVLMQGITQATGGGNFRISGVDPRYSAYLSGTQSLNGDFSRNMFDNVLQNFFPGNVAQRHRTHGMNMSDMGVMFSEMQQRGAFTGMQLGSVEMMTEPRLKELRQRASGDPAALAELSGLKAGDIRKTISPDTQKRITDMIEDGAATLASVREIFGAQSMDVLIKEAERITGMTFSGGRNIKDMRARMEGAQVQAKMFGLNEREFMEFDFKTSMSTAQGLAARTGMNFGDAYRVSAATTPVITAASLSANRQQQDAANRAAADGRHLEVYSAQQLAERAADGTAAFLAYDVSALTASNVIDNFGDAAGKARHAKLLTDLGNARSDEQASAIKRKMLDNAQGYYTGNIDDLHGEASDEAGRARMLRMMSQSAVTALGKSAAMQELRSRQGVQVDFRAAQAGVQGLTSDEMLDFQSKFDMKTREDIAGALNGKNGWDKVDLSILGDQAAQDAYRDKLVRANVGSGNELGRQLSTYNAYAAADETLAGTYSQMDERSHYRGILSEAIAASSMGDVRGRIGVMEQLRQGAAGRLQIDSKMIARYVEETGRHGDGSALIGIGENGAASITAGDKAKIAAMMQASGKSLEVAMGVGSVEEAFAKMNTAEGMGEAIKALRDAGLVVSDHNDGDGKFKGFFIGSEQMRKDVTKELEAKQSTIRGAQLTGMTEEEYLEFTNKEKDSFRAALVAKGLLAPGAALTAEQQTAFQGAVAGAEWDQLLKGKVGDRQLDKLSEAIMKDPFSDEAKGYKAYISENADMVMPMLKAEEDRLAKLAAEGGKDAEVNQSASDRIKAVRERMSMENSNTFYAYLLNDRGESWALYNKDGQRGAPGK